MRSNPILTVLMSTQKETLAEVFGHKQNALHHGRFGKRLRPLGGTRDNDMVKEGLFSTLCAYWAKEGSESIQFWSFSTRALPDLLRRI